MRANSAGQCENGFGAGLLAVIFNYMNATQAAHAGWTDYCEGRNQFGRLLSVDRTVAEIYRAAWLAAASVMA